MSESAWKDDCHVRLSSETIADPMCERFLQHLQHRGHTEGTAHAYLAAAEHYWRWLARQAPVEHQVNADTVRRFLNEHLPACDCPPPVYRQRTTMRAALNQLLGMQGYPRLQQLRVPASAAIEAALSSFDSYLRDIQGLAGATRQSRCHFVRAFLEDLFGSAPLDFARLTPSFLIDYITVQAERLTTGSAGVLVTALHSYLRFLQFRGICIGIPGDTLPRPAHWSLVTLPPRLTEAELSRFWQGFDRSTSIGKRDYAMARCLADLALRCHEVAELRLENIDWRHGVLSLPHTKTLRADRLPLPELTAQALIDYLRVGRPVCRSRAVFVYQRAPLGEAVRTTTVHGAIDRAFARAGLPWRGTHVLRHTAAARLLQAGCSIKAIADVMRHRSIDTTAIYTKVDLPHLIPVALPWPGAQP